MTDPKVEYQWDETQWGMVIDVDRCIGCEACVVACRSENNIPTVGEEQAAMSRIMDWIHLERFYTGEYPNVRAEFVPMLCQQCGNAPCESVCPVFASVHTNDGLNAQVYNRCVGTRFCANNCPYHVRKFNYYPPTWQSPLEQQLNPDVTARKSGVMEKCTFCIQRIRKAELDHRLEGTQVSDGQIRPACVQSCPTEAMLFGDLKDKNSAVASLANSSRSNRVLDDLNINPHIIYLRPERVDNAF